MQKLNKGDKIGIVSTSNSVKPKDIELGIKYLTSLGFECVLGKNVFNKYRWMAGTEQEIVDDLISLYENKDIKAIFCSSGGAGSQKILEKIDYEKIKQNPKPLFGFSDTTALQLAIYSRANAISYTGFLLKHDFKNGKIDKMVEESLAKIINGKLTTISSGKSVIKGKTEGTLVGGCLSLLCNLSGTEYFPNLEGAILLVEDVDEKTYKIDLMLDQIKKNPSFKKLKGIVFGQFADCTISEAQPTTIDEIIDLFCKDLKIPVIKDFPYGHNESRRILPIGSTVTLDAQNCELSFL